MTARDASTASAKQRAAQQRQLMILAAALVASMSTWFSTAAVLPQLRDQWGLSTVAGSWLTILVQIGFVAGALFTSLTNLADRIAPRRLILIGTVGAALANAIVALADSFATAIPARFLTGCFLAAVYPSAMKVMASWYREGRGFALGVMIGALTVGSALPHLINAFGGLNWQLTMYATSALTLAGGIAAESLASDGPYAVPTAPFDPSQIGAILRNRSFRLASAGYFGHMWELFAMWAWMAAFYGDVFDSRRAASLAAFAVVAIGAVGCLHAGVISDRQGRTQAASLALRWSSAAALVTGFLVDAPGVVVLIAGLIWGYWVIADSAQFSTIVTEVSDPRYVGTALTLQLAAGFVLTVFTIFLVPVVRDASSWGWAFAMLAPGPLLGWWAMHRLQTTALPQLGDSP